LQWREASGICRGALFKRGRRGREAEGGGLLNRYRVVKLYRGFESLRLRQALKVAIDLEMTTPIPRLLSRAARDESAESGGVAQEPTARRMANADQKHCRERELT
jgi:hypothetical protein